jgi:hypothetical protein
MILFFLYFMSDKAKISSHKKNKNDARTLSTHSLNMHALATLYIVFYLGCPQPPLCSILQG